jgi:hypothetical protein
MAWLVIVWQLSVKYRRIMSVGMYLKYIKNNNLLIVKKLNKQKNIVLTLKIMFITNLMD